MCLGLRFHLVSTSVRAMVLGKSRSTSRTRNVIRRVGVFLIGLAILAPATTYCCYQRLSWVGSAAAQARRARSRTQSKPANRKSSDAINNPGISIFKHESHRLPKVDRTCASCHNVLQKEAPKLVAAATTTKINELPYHDKCLDCHRTRQPTFFAGTRPVVCSVCHTHSSPRLTKTDLNPFPRQNEQTILGDLSLKFNHQESKHLRECTSCHLNIGRLDVAKADAPISNCATSDCHSKAGVKPGFEDQMLQLEDDDIAGDRNRHTCIGCHSTSIGGTPPPCTHSKLFDKDGTYFNSKDFPKSAKLISEKCKS